MRVLESDRLRDLRGEILRCIKCGNCQAVCPVYKEERRESAAPRGRVQLAVALLRGEISPTRRLAAIFDLCLTCLACKGVCPSGVDIPRIILAVRSLLYKQGLIDRRKAAVLSLLTHSSLLNAGAFLARPVQGLVLKHLPGGDGDCSLRLGSQNQRRILPSIKYPLYKRRLPRSAVRPKGRLAFFYGCLLNHFYPGDGEAVIKILTTLGYEVDLPPQVCCGLPSLVSGDLEKARDLARINLASFQGYEAVITACATCAESWRNYLPQVLPPGEKRNAAAVLAERSYEFTQFLALEDLSAKLGDIRGRATYHDPCHLVRGLGVKVEPRQLLGALPGLEFVELKDADRCCGGAGSFSLTHYSTAMAINQKKTQAIALTGADLVATTCPACRMQLSAGIALAGVPARVVHVAELVWRSLQSASQGGNTAGLTGA